MGGSVKPPTKLFRVSWLIKGRMPEARGFSPIGGCFYGLLSSSTWPRESNSLVQGTTYRTAAAGPFLAFIEDKHNLSKYYSGWAYK